MRHVISAALDQTKQPTEKNMNRTPFLAVATIVAVLGVAAALLGGCSGSGHNDLTTQSGDPPAQKSDKTVQYTCSMHPEVVRDKPGDCPKCGMKLVEKR
jgi:hypothetical protein